MYSHNPIHQNYPLHPSHPTRSTHPFLPNHLTHFTHLTFLTNLNSLANPSHPINPAHPTLSLTQHFLLYTHHAYLTYPTFSSQFVYLTHPTLNVLDFHDFGRNSTQMEFCKLPFFFLCSSFSSSHFP